jgi:hypothetical protein
MHVRVKSEHYVQLYHSSQYSIYINGLYLAFTQPNGRVGWQVPDDTHTNTGRHTHQAHATHRYNSQRVLTARPQSTAD